MELGYIVWVCSLLDLKLFPHTGKSPWQGTDRRLLHDLTKQEISLAASPSTGPVIKVILKRAIRYALYSCCASRCQVCHSSLNAMFVFYYTRTGLHILYIYITTVMWDTSLSRLWNLWNYDVSTKILSHPGHLNLGVLGRRQLKFLSCLKMIFHWRSL